MNNVYNNDLGFSKWGRSRLSIPNTVYPSIHPVDMPVDAGGTLLGKMPGRKISNSQ